MTETPPTDHNADAADAMQKRAARRRRKDARPAEIIDAAIAVFGERGFGATRLEDVARRAGVSKGTVFVYFENKDALFRAAAHAVMKDNIDALQNISALPDLPVAQIVPMLLARAAIIGRDGLPPMAQVIIREAHAFPDLARMWHEEVVSKVFGTVIAILERAQAKHEIRKGDARLQAFSLLGPMMAGMLFRQVFSQTDAALPDLGAQAAEHAQTALYGLLDRTGH